MQFCYLSEFIKKVIKQLLYQYNKTAKKKHNKYHKYYSSKKFLSVFKMLKNKKSSYKFLQDLMAELSRNIIKQ